MMYFCHLCERAYDNAQWDAAQHLLDHPGCHDYVVEVPDNAVIIATTPYLVIRGRRPDEQPDGWPDEIGETP